MHFLYSWNNKAYWSATYWYSKAAPQLTENGLDLLAAGDLCKFTLLMICIYIFIRLLRKGISTVFTGVINHRALLLKMLRHCSGWYCTEKEWIKHWSTYVICAVISIFNAFVFNCLSEFIEWATTPTWKISWWLIPLKIFSHKWNAACPLGNTIKIYYLKFHLLLFLEVSWGKTNNTTVIKVFLKKILKKQEREMQSAESSTLLADWGETSTALWEHHQMKWDETTGIRH